MNELTRKKFLEGTLDQLGTAGPRIIAALTACISKQHRDKRNILGGDQREALKGPDQVHELTQKRSVKGTPDQRGEKVVLEKEDKLSRLTSMTKSTLRAKRSIALNPSKQERDQSRPSG